MTSHQDFPRGLVGKLHVCRTMGRDHHWFQLDGSWIKDLMLAAGFQAPVGETFQPQSRQLCSKSKPGNTPDVRKCLARPTRCLETCCSVNPITRPAAVVLTVAHIDQGRSPGSNILRIWAHRICQLYQASSGLAEDSKLVDSHEIGSISPVRICLGIMS